MYIFIFFLEILIFLMNVDCFNSSECTECSTGTAFIKCFNGTALHVGCKYNCAGENNRVIRACINHCQQRTYPISSLNISLSPQLGKYGWSRYCSSKLMRPPGAHSFGWTLLTLASFSNQFHISLNSFTPYQQWHGSLILHTTRLVDWGPNHSTTQTIKMAKQLIKITPCSLEDSDVMDAGEKRLCMVYSTYIWLTYFAMWQTSFLLQGPLFLNLHFSDCTMMFMAFPMGFFWIFIIYPAFTSVLWTNMGKILSNNLVSLSLMGKLSYF